MGHSDPPGWFFALAVASASTAALLFWLEVGAWAWGLVAVAVIAAGALFPALMDAEHVACPKCGLKPPIRPWSF